MPHRDTARKETSTVFTNIFIDGNNVMGSRPDGWWRNRAKAANQLAAEVLLLACHTRAAWTIVFDGPRPPSAPTPHDCLTILHTDHRGRDGADNYIVQLVRSLPDPADTLVYTSDATLRARILALGAHVIGARSLLEEIATADPGNGTRHRRRSPSQNHAT